MSSEDGSIGERLAKMLADGGDWEKTQTSVEGAMIVRMPQFKNRPPVLALEINPAGPASKKRGILIRSSSELYEISRIVGNADLAKLADAIDKTNPASSSAPPKQGGDVFKI